MVGSVEEWFQWFIPNRVGEMKDVFLNLAAIGTGLLFAAAIDPRLSGALRSGVRLRRTVRLMATATSGGFATFLQIVHLGIG